jgi:hypothetical protein
VWVPAEGEMVLFSTTGACYYGLDEVAARIWMRLNEGAATGDVVETLLAEFEVDRVTAQSEVERLLRELTDKRLLVTA